MKKVSLFLVSILALAFQSFNAMATYLDASASTVVSTVQADAATVFGYGWTLLGVIFGGVLIMGIFKRITSKAAGR